MAIAAALLALWVGFAATHVAMSADPIRPRLVAKLGERGFLGVYSLVALGFFVPLVLIYSENKHAGPWLWILRHTLGAEATMWIGMTLAFLLLFAGFVRRSPAGVLPGRIEVAGVFRLTRHPVFMALGLFGALHVVPNATPADIAFFGGFPVFAVVGSMHQDHRKIANGPPGYREFRDRTPLIPFTGGETALGFRELSPFLYVAAFGATLLTRHFHFTLFGP